jgi:hypothetical protein
VAEAVDPRAAEQPGRAAPARLTWIVWIGVTSVAAVAVLVPKSGVPNIRAGFSPASILVKPGQEIVQSFRARARGVDTIALRLVEAPLSGFALVAVEFSLKQQLIARRTRKVALQDLSGRRSWRLDFEPIEGSREGIYRIRIAVEGTPEASGLVLATAEGHEYTDGELLVDGEKQSVDLVMRVNARRASAWSALQALLAERLGWGGWIWVVAIGYSTLVLLLLRGFVRV